MIHNIFQIPIYGTKLSLDNSAIRSHCLSLTKIDKGRVKTNSGGWQSNNLPKNEKVLTPFYQGITYHANEFLKRLEFNGDLYLDNIWININGYKDYNIAHKHDNAHISGVYYVRTPKNCGNIIFNRPGIDEFTYDWNENHKAFNFWNSATRWQRAEESMLYLFPGWLNHYVEPNLNRKEKRISISFNFTLKAI